jgi:L-lactate dehydrogenase complex protein LldF
VFRVAGGHSYGWVYSGPIGAIITPLLIGLEMASPLPYASSLCGACKQACPVDIDLPRMLLDLRRDLVAAGESPHSWNLALRLWARAMRSPVIYKASDKAAAMATRVFQPQTLPGPLGGWTAYRTAPNFAQQSFRDWWAEQASTVEEHDQ